MSASLGILPPITTRQVVSVYLSNSESTLLVCVDFSETAKVGFVGSELSVDAISENEERFVGGAQSDRFMREGDAASSSSETTFYKRVEVGQVLFDVLHY